MSYSSILAHHPVVVIGSVLAIVAICVLVLAVDIELPDFDDPRKVIV